MVGFLRIVTALHALAADAPPPAPAPMDEQKSQHLLLVRFADRSEADAERLREQVTIYTRDVGLDVRVLPVGSPSATPTAVADALALLREHGARLAFWCDPAEADGTVTLHLVDARGVAGRRVIKTGGPAELDRTVALKLRAVLSGTAAVDAPASEPQPAPAARVSPSAPETAPAAHDPSKPVDGGALAHTADRGALDSGTSRLSVGVGYRFTAPSGLAPISHAVNLSAALVLARYGELVIGTSLAGRSSHGSSAGQVALLDVPLRIGARALARWNRAALGAGAFGAFHFLDVTAQDADGRQAGSSAFAGAGGVELLGRWRVRGGIAGELRAQVELPVPRTRFWVQDVPTYDFGPRVGFSLGLVFSAL